MGEYGQTAKVATNAAVKTVEDKAAVTAAERAALVKPVVHPVEAVIPPTPASTTARIGSELTAPKVGEIATTSPSLFSRFRSSVTSPFKSLLGTPEGAVGETKNLATRVDGLKAGEGSLSRPTISPVVHPAERLPVGLRTPETRIGETRIGETKLAESRLPQSHVPEVTQPPAVRPTSLQHPIKLPIVLLLVLLLTKLQVAPRMADPKPQPKLLPKLRPKQPFRLLPSLPFMLKVRQVSSIPGPLTILFLTSLVRQTVESKLKSRL
jgi:hypothetical protein